jgi:hypothetical protein
MKDNSSLRQILQDKPPEENFNLEKKVKLENLCWRLGMGRRTRLGDDH